MMGQEELRVFCVYEPVSALSCSSSRACSTCSGPTSLFQEEQDGPLTLTHASGSL